MDGLNDPPLAGVKVLDLTGAAAGPFATSMLAGLGAQVVKIDSAGVEDVMLSRPPKQHGTALSVGYLAYNRGKSSILLDLRDDADRQVLYELARDADVLVDSKRPGVATKLGYGYDDIAAINPSIVYASLDSWGAGTELAGKPGTAPLVEWYSGWASIQGRADGRAEMDRYGCYVDHAAALALVSGVVVALVDRLRSQRGQRVAVSLLGASVAMQASRLASHLGGTGAARWGSASPYLVPDQAFACSDGTYLAVTASSDADWQRLCDAVGRADLARDPRFRTNRQRVRNRRALDEILSAVFAAGPRDRWQVVLRRAAISNAGFADWPSIRDDYSLRSSGTLRLESAGDFGDMYLPALPWRFEGVPPTDLPAVTPGRDSDVLRNRGWRPATSRRMQSSGSLAGVRVVDVSQGLCGPYAARLMGDDGATVVKVEPEDGDYVRSWGGTESEGESLYDMMNAGKAVVRADVSQADGRARLWEQLADADVLICDWTEEFAIENRVDRSTLSRDFPELLCVSVTPSGHERLRGLAEASELTVQAAVEACAGLGEVGAEPVRNGVDVAAAFTALTTVAGVYAMLFARAHGSRCTRLDVDQVSTMIFMRITAWASRSDPEEWAGWGPHLYAEPEFAYRAQDGEVYPFLMRGDEETFRALLAGLKLDRYAGDARFAEGGRYALGTGKFAQQLRPVWEKAFAGWSVRSLIALFDRHGIGMVPINSYDDLLKAPAFVEEFLERRDALITRKPWRVIRQG